MNRAVLVVDDEPLIRWALYEELKERFTVMTAGSVDHAMRILQAMHIDAMVTDLRIAGRNAMELVEYIRKQMPQINIFIVTGSGSDEELDRAYKLEVDGYFRKPFEAARLRDLLTARLDDASNVA